MTEINCSHSPKANYKMKNDGQDISYGHLRDSNIPDNNLTLNHNTEAYNEEKGRIMNYRNVLIQMTQ